MTFSCLRFSNTFHCAYLNCDASRTVQYILYNSFQKWVIVLELLYTVPIYWPWWWEAFGWCMMVGCHKTIHEHCHIRRTLPCMGSTLPGMGPTHSTLAFLGSQTRSTPPKRAIHRCINSGRSTIEESSYQMEIDDLFRFTCVFGKLMGVCGYQYINPFALLMAWRHKHLLSIPI